MTTAGLTIGQSEPAGPAPSPPAHWLFGHLGELRKDPLGLLVRARASHGDVVSLKLWSMTAHLLSHPDHLDRVLQKKQSGYDKDLVVFKRLSPVLGQGMLTADGEVWRRQREVARPAFHQTEIKSFGPAITATSRDVVARWREAAKTGEPIDLHQEMMHVTLRVAGRALFGVDLKDEAVEASDVLNVIMAAGQERVRSAVVLPMILPTKNNRQIGQSRRALVEMIDRIIERREAGLGEGALGEGGEAAAQEDLFARLLAAHGARDPSGRSQQFYDEAITILLAGHETTANALSFSLYLLGRHPEILADVRDEAKAVLGGRAAEVGDIPKLRLTRRVLDEAMRIYPPAWLFDRNAVEQDEIGGYLIPKGSIMLMSPFVVHRHPDFWPEPERFDPRRFEKEEAAKRPRHAYFPFSFGPRVCIGTTFALTEAVMVLATLAGAFDLAPVEGYVLRLDPSITLRPKDGLPMMVRAL